MARRDDEEEAAREVWPPPSWRDQRPLSAHRGLSRAADADWDDLFSGSSAPAPHPPTGPDADPESAPTRRRHRFGRRRRGGEDLPMAPAPEPVPSEAAGADDLDGLFTETDPPEDVAPGVPEPVGPAPAGVAEAGGDGRPGGFVGLDDLLGADDDTTPLPTTEPGPPAFVPGASEPADDAPAEPDTAPRAGADGDGGVDDLFGDAAAPVAQTPEAQTTDAAVVDEDWDPDDEAELAAWSADLIRVRRTTPEWVRVVVAAGAALAMVAVVVVVFTRAAVPRSFNTDPLANTDGAPIHQIAYSGRSAPGFADTPSWERTPPKGTASAATPMGLVEVAGETITLRDIATGAPVMSRPLSGPVTFTTTAVIGGTNALLWRSDGRLWWWAPGAEGSVAIDDDATVTQPGTRVLVTDADRTATFLDPTGALRPAPAAHEGQTVLAVDDDAWLAADMSGASVSTTEGVNSDVALVEPTRGWQIVRWLGAGHGWIVTVWGAVADPRSDEDVVVAVHDWSGDLVSATAMSWADAEVARWTRTQGGDWGTFGQVSVDMASGRITARCDDCTMSGGFADWVRVTTPSGSGWLRGTDLWLTSADLVAAATDGRAVIIATSDGAFHGYRPA